jgi:hypothetical protein
LILGREIGFSGSGHEKSPFEIWMEAPTTWMQSRQNLDSRRQKLDAVNKKWMAPGKIQIFEIQCSDVVQKSKFVQPSRNPEIHKSRNPNCVEIQKSTNPKMQFIPGIQKSRNPKFQNMAIFPKLNFRLSSTNPKLSAHPKIKVPAPVQESGNPNYAARTPPLPPHGGGRRPLPPNTPRIAPAGACIWCKNETL